MMLSDKGKKLGVRMSAGCSPNIFGVHVADQHKTNSMLLTIMSNEANNVVTKDPDLRKFIYKDQREQFGKTKYDAAHTSEKLLHCKLIKNEGGKTFPMSTAKYDDKLAVMPSLNEKKEAKDGFLGCVLTMIFMEQHSTPMKDPLTEKKFWEHLEEFGIEKDVKDPALGDISEVISDFISAGWLVTRKLIDAETQNPYLVYEWGPKAHINIDPKELLSFFCQEIDDTSTREWPLHHKASKQLSKERADRLEHSNLRR